MGVGEIEIYEMKIWPCFSKSNSEKFVKEQTWFFLCRIFRKIRGGNPWRTKRGPGRPSIHNKISKMVLRRSLPKRRQSTRKLAKRLSAKGHQIYQMTVHRYLVKNLVAKAMKRQKIPKLIPQHKNKRLEKSLVESWKKIRLEILDNLYLSMPSRILDVIRCKGGYLI